MEIYSPYNIDLEKISGDKNAWDLFTQKIEHLDDSQRKLLFSADTPYILQAICLTYNFSESQSAELSRIIRDVIFREIKGIDFVQEVVTRLDIDTSTSEVIKNEVKDKLFTSTIQKGQGGMEVGPVKQSRPQPPDPSQMKNGPPINQSNVIDLRNQS